MSDNLFKTAVSYTTQANVSKNSIVVIFQVSDLDFRVPKGVTTELTIFTKLHSLAKLMHLFSSFLISRLISPTKIQRTAPITVDHPRGATPGRAKVPDLRGHRNNARLLQVPASDHRLEPIYSFQFLHLLRGEVKWK